MSILRFKMSALRNEEHFQFMTDIKQEITAEGPETLNVVTQFQDFTALYQQEDLAMEIIRKSPLTQDITIADDARDNVFRGLILAIESNLHNPGANEHQAANNLKVIIDHYGNITHKSYNEETASIHNLIQDLNAHAADLLSLNIQSWVDNLDNTNQAFNDLMNQRFNDLAVQEHGKLTDIRRDIDKVYLKIIERIEAFILLQGPDTFADFVNRLNQRIAYFKNTLAVRRGRASKKDSE